MQLSVAAEHHQALKQSCQRAEVVSARLANHYGELVLVFPLQPLGNLYIISMRIFLECSPLDRNDWYCGLWSTYAPVEI